MHHVGRHSRQDQGSEHSSAARGGGGIGNVSEAGALRAGCGRKWSHWPLGYSLAQSAATLPLAPQDAGGPGPQHRHRHARAIAHARQPHHAAHKPQTACQQPCQQPVTAAGNLGTGALLLGLLCMALAASQTKSSMFPPQLPWQESAYSSSCHQQLPCCSHCGWLTLNAREDGDEGMESRIEDDELHRVVEGIQNAADENQVDGTKRQVHQDEQWIGWTPNISEWEPIKKWLPASEAQFLMANSRVLDHQGGCHCMACMHPARPPLVAAARRVGDEQSTRRAAGAAQESWLQRRCGMAL